jgi:hypothetical protein
MANKFVRSIIAGIVATAVMTAFMYMAPLMGMPEMNPAEMLSGMLGVSVVIGWMMHFIIGIIFAAIYVFFFNPLVHIHSRAGKGLLHGFIVFVFAQGMMFLMSKIMPATSGPNEGNMLLMMVGSLIGHLVFGLVIGLIVPLEEKEAGQRQNNRYQVT